MTTEDLYYYLKGLPSYLFRTPEQPGTPKQPMVINEDYYLSQEKSDGCSVYDIIEKGKQLVTKK